LCVGGILHNPLHCSTEKLHKSLDVNDLWSLCFLRLSESGLPVAYRASFALMIESSGSWNRTSGLLLQRQASLPTATAPDRFVTWTHLHILGFGGEVLRGS
jgi:hypothetical protein